MKVVKLKTEEHKIEKQQRESPGSKEKSFGKSGSESKAGVAVYKNGDKNDDRADNKSDEVEVVANNVVIVNTFFKKLSGLIFRKKLKDKEGLVIEGCRSIHTLGMRYNIDVVFLDNQNRVIAIFQNMKPFRVTPFLKNASKVVELRSGTIKNTSLKVGDLVDFRE